MTQPTKKSIVWAVLSPLVTVNEKNEKVFSKPRKELIDDCYNALIEAGVDKHDIKPHLITSYLQMARMEMLKGESAYKHHKYKSKKANDGEEAKSEPEVLIPADAQWMAVQGEVVEYFKNRQQARDFAKDQDGKWAINKVAH
jgi:hypothetical protein